MSRVHPHDKSDLSRALHRAIVTGEPYRATYRVLSRSDNYIDVVAMGRCFPGLGDAPVYAGIVFPATATATGSGDRLLMLCLAAFAEASERGKLEIVGHLNAAIKILANNSDSDGVGWH